MSTCFLNFAQISWQTMLCVSVTDWRLRASSRVGVTTKTPTRIRIPEPESKGNDKCSQALGVQNTSGRVTAKVFQRKMELGFLFCGTSAASEQPAHVFLRSYVPCPLQLVDQCTAENLRWIQMEQEQRIQGLQRVSQQFPLKLSIASTDRHYSNKAAERSLTEDDVTWQCHHVFCDVHKVAQMQEPSRSRMKKQNRSRNPKP